ncbi:MAG: hydroxyacid dehydrogenase [Clostridia bacterium]|nr:hydroxyacid dehydrogenase [Clostridia bacterium]
MNIVVLDRSSLGEDTPLESLNRYGNVTVYERTSREELLERASDAEVLVLNKVKIDKEVLDASPKLKLICITATGYDNVDIIEARSHGVAVTNVPGYSTDSVTLLTVATVLSLITHLREYNEYVTDGSYTRSGIANKLSPVYHELRGMKWGIVGYGNIGKAVARVAEAFGAEVLVNKRTPVADARCVTLEELCKESDIITLHCPLNENTRELIGVNELALMKPSAILVNEARGAVVDSVSVANAIKRGELGAFGADVYEVEPFGKDHPFTEIMHLPNVLLTPHAAWGAYDSRKRCIETVAANIGAFISNKIKNRVDIQGQ